MNKSEDEPRVSEGKDNKAQQTGNHDTKKISEFFRHTSKYSTANFILVITGLT